MHHSQSVTIDTNAKFEVEYAKKIQLLLTNRPVNRGNAHAMRDDTTAYTHELLHVTEAFRVPGLTEQWARVVRPNLPWAEDHFQERVSGEPWNPAPSEQWWPFARRGNAEHKKDEVFSHTYPERYWPKVAGVNCCSVEQCPSHKYGNQGIRFAYGDLNDLVEILKQNVWSRQAYLPVWFPEDLTAARAGERVPCSMGYHFMRVDGGMDCVYTMRSCDVVRFYRDDVYMAGRLLQWVCHKIGVPPGKLVVHIDNLHCFPGDRPFLEKYLPKGEVDLNDTRRANYNLDAMF